MTASQISLHSRCVSNIGRALCGNAREKASSVVSSRLPLPASRVSQHRAPYVTQATQAKYFFFPASWPSHFFSFEFSHAFQRLFQDFIQFVIKQLMYLILMIFLRHFSKGLVICQHQPWDIRKHQVSSSEKVYLQQQSSFTAI